MPYKSFEDLDVWKRALQQAIDVCLQVGEWRNFALKDQMTRSAISVPSNIAEGQERDYSNDFVRFLRIAEGSNGELRTQIYIARGAGLIEPDFAENMITESKEISRMIQGLIRSVQAPT